MAWEALSLEALQGLAARDSVGMAGGSPLAHICEWRYGHGLQCLEPSASVLLLPYRSVALLGALFLVGRPQAWLLPEQDSVGHTAFE